MKVPQQIVRITGSAPLTGTVYEMQCLRCNLCGEIFTADSPEGMGGEKYDAASRSIIALLKYGSGMPFNRLENFQQGLVIPLPASTQSEIVDQVADVIEPVYTEFNLYGVPWKFIFYPVLATSEEAGEGGEYVR